VREAISTNSLCQPQKPETLKPETYKNAMFKLQITTILLCLWIFACKNANHSEQMPSPVGEMEKSAAPPAPPQASRGRAADIAADALISENQFESAVGKVQAIDSAKQLIRTATLKFRAKKVLDAALLVERIAQQNGGFVLQNEYRENQVQQYNRRISADSSERITVVEPVCHVLIRVPFRQMDTTLRSIGRLALVLDYRNLQAQDVSLDIMEQNLAALRNQAYGDAVSGDIAEKGDHLKDITAAREREFNAKQGEDIAKIERMRIEDQVRYSTVTVDIYENNTRRTEMIAFQQTSRDWKPNLFTRIGNGLVTGWNLLSEMIIGLISIWPFLLLLVAAIWIWRRKRSTPH
jgi:hypothetical protein